MHVLRLLVASLLPWLASASPVNTVPSMGKDVCLDDSSIPAVATNLNADTPMTGSTSSSEKKNLPVFFFHGLTGNSTEGFNFQANLTAEGRVFVPLAFCERECSLTALNIQVPMAIAAVQEVVTHDERFANGYIFLGHSQGAMMARAVIEQMDDHKVHTFVSLAGGVNGIFYGPQEADRNSIHDLGAGFGAAVLPQNLFDFTGYAPEGYRGKMQADLARRSMDAKIQAAYSITNLLRTPVRDVWLATNQFLPMINNVNTCAWFDFHCHVDKIRRKHNFLRLKQAHYFASPEDGVASPWQANHLGHYRDVGSLEEIESKFESLSIVEMHDTVEYKEDTYGLRTLDERGALFRYTARGVLIVAGCTTFQSSTWRDCASSILSTTGTCTTCFGRAYIARSSLNTSSIYIFKNRALKVVLRLLLPAAIATSSIYSTFPLGNDVCLDDRRCPLTRKVPQARKDPRSRRKPPGLCYSCCVRNG